MEREHALDLSGVQVENCDISIKISGSEFRSTDLQTCHLLLIAIQFTSFLSGSKSLISYSSEKDSNYSIYLKSQIKMFSTAAAAKYLPLVLFKSTKTPFDLELAMILKVADSLYFRYCFVRTIFDA
jgi:hypothetical protein